MRLALAAALVLVACGGSAPASTDGSTSTTTSSTGTTAAPIDCAVEPDALFIKRIAPLLATDRPKTCNTCHLSGVDMEMFVQDTPCQTMACLDDRGLVDLTDPQASLVLQWISRADPASPLIDQSVIDEEYAAFLAWIEATAECGLCWSGDSPCGEPSGAKCEEDEAASAWVDPGDCSPLTRESMFRHKVYAWRDRCFPCHFDSHDFEAPKWIATGSCELGSLMTMRNVLERGLVDFAAPDQSLLLLKPLAESEGGVMHGGHTKFADKSDEAYVDFLAWISREVACTP
ncbi:hypothetical protein [Nannocystis bainbridge]|uniref:Cytochrome c domain-containing protein n=1 Tax=Nannocystis bainbridge TaxID=2995303 RepID=A0ABT5DXM7_9BACT|nr:hypothetical protein [Nannocystis bainbridge]MDC0718372.1 hypothetical protein [Nannocystis bainbridge]